MVASASSAEMKIGSVRRSRLGRQLRTFPWLAIGPTVLLLVFLTVFPLLYSLYLSLHNYQLGGAATWSGSRTTTRC